MIDAVILIEIMEKSFLKKYHETRSSGRFVFGN